MKYLLLVAIVAVIWWALKKRPSQSGKRPAPAARDPERMVVCAHCGVHLPQSECVTENGACFCSDAHRLAARVPTGHD
jgi:uncharacterized protein